MTLWNDQQNLQLALRRLGRELARVYRIDRLVRWLNDKLERRQP